MFPQSIAYEHNDQWISASKANGKTMSTIDKFSGDFMIRVGFSSLFLWQMWPCHCLLGGLCWRNQVHHCCDNLCPRLRQSGCSCHSTYISCRQRQNVCRHIIWKLLALIRKLYKNFELNIKLASLIPSPNFGLGLTFRIDTLIIRSISVNFSLFSVHGSCLSEACHY